MNVAMIVHNNVVSDVRVQKEARTLSSHGFHVEVHGVSRDGATHEGVLPGSDVRVFWAGSGKHPMARIMSLPAAILHRVMTWARKFVDLYATASADEATTDRIALGVGRRFGKGWRALRLWLVGHVLQSESKWAVAVIHRRYKKVGARLAESVAARAAPDVVHIHDHVALTSARWLKEHIGCTIVWDAHEIYESLGVADKARLIANRQVIRDMQNYVDHFITINDSIADFYRESYPALGNATVVMNAQPRGRQVEYDGRLHEAAGLPQGHRIILFQGGFASGRGLRELIRAAPLFRPEWTLVMMGWGALEDELRTLAASEAGNRVVFLPGVPQDELGAWTRGATLGAIPYEDIGLNHRYCTPNKLWEYPEAGVPILCTDLEELGQIVRSNGIGFIVPREFDGPTIARVVNGIDDTELANARDACPRFIDSNHWDIYGERLCNLYASIAENQDSVSNGNLSHAKATE